MFAENRWGFVCVSILSFGLAGCPSPPALVVDGGVPPTDVRLADVPTSIDAPIRADVPATPDTPSGLDVSIGLDAPVAVDAPTGIDAPDPDAGPADAGAQDAGLADAGPADTSTPLDAPADSAMSLDAPAADAPLPICGMPGQVGGHCTAMACAGGIRCQNEVLMAGALFTIGSAFGIDQGEPDPFAVGFYRLDGTPTPAAEIPLPMATGSLCTNDCDAGAALDTCGACSTCATDIGNIGVLATYLLYPATARPFGNDTGWCRADCDFDPAVRGLECPTGHTCSPSSRVCVESCSRDTECQFSFEETREGEFVTAIDPTAGTCNMTTGRCDWTHPATESTGDACDRASDCSEDTGICINGGTCGEYDCAGAPDTTTAFVCDGGRGICLGNGGNGGSICVAGCVAAADCNPGSTCIPLGGGMTAGPFRGYCLGICDEFRNDPDGPGPLVAADDVLWACQAGEACDQVAPNAANFDPNGACRPPCTTDAQCTGAAERCDIPAGMATGFCRVPDQVCTRANLSADCFLGQVCDLLAYPGALGLCVEPCLGPAMCAPDVCSARQVCRATCVGTGMSTCNTEETCQAGLCDQDPTL